MFILSFIVNNDEHCSVQFERSDDVMNIGKYELVEAHTRGCTSELHAGNTGELVPVYSASFPTNAPTTPGHELNAKGEL